MYIGEMESMGSSLASILGMCPSTFDHLSNSTSNLTEQVTIKLMDGKEDCFLAFTVEEGILQIKFIAQVLLVPNPISKQVAIDCQAKY
jgi:hypothetical protein